MGQGQVKPVEAKVEAITDFSVPSCNNNFAFIAEPLTNLLGKRVKFIWTDYCQKSF